MELTAFTLEQTNQAANIAAWLAARPEPLWLVGGAVRDALAGQLPSDIDLMVAGDALALARALARDLGYQLAILDPRDGVARITGTDLPFTLDIAAMQGADIGADLAARDFTVNALALPFTPAVLKAIIAGAGDALTGQMIDPTGGQADLAELRLRSVSDQTFTADPVRLLRAARLATKLNLTITSETMVLARASAGRLPTMPPARLTAELYAILARRAGTRAMHLLDDLGALTVLVPPLALCRGVKQGRLHYWDVFDHTLAVIDSLDRVVDLLTTGLSHPDLPCEPDGTGRIAHPMALDLGGKNARLLDLLRQPLAEGQTRLTLLKLATLFHDVGKPQTRMTLPNGDFRFPGHADAGAPLAAPVLDAWQVGKVARRFITSLIVCHMRPGQLAGPQGVSDRAVRHFFRDAGDAGLDVAVFSIADHLAVYGPSPLTPFWSSHRAAVVELVRRAYDEPERVWPARLLDGNDLVARFGVPRGPAVGRMLAIITEAQLNGEIATRAEALALASQLTKGATEHAGTSDSADRI